MCTVRLLEVKTVNIIVVVIYLLELKVTDRIYNALDIIHLLVGHRWP